MPTNHISASHTSSERLPERTYPRCSLEIYFLCVCPLFSLEMLRSIALPSKWARLRPPPSLQARCLTSLAESDLNHFSKILSPSSIISTLPPSNSAADELETFNTDWMGKYRGKSRAVLKPKTTQEVSEILKWCWERRIGVVPQGGNTGLVGGGVPLNDEVILNLGNMNKIRSFDPVSGTYSCPWRYACVLT